MSASRNSTTKPKRALRSVNFSQKEAVTVVDDNMHTQRKSTKSLRRTRSTIKSAQDSDATVEKITFKPGKWRKSMSILRAGNSRRESSGSFAGNRRITMYIADYRSSLIHNDSHRSTVNDDPEHPQDSITSSNDITIHQFATPLVAVQMVSDRCYLRLKSSRNEVLQRCRQTEPISFEEMFSKLNIDVKQKIGEGVYGEVFQCTKANEARSVLKLVPIEGSLLINGEKQKTFDEILSEVVISLELSNLRQRSVQFYTDGFVELQSVSCVKGHYPKSLQDLWKRYDEQKGSQNDNPDSFGADQLYVAFETAYGGKELDGFKFKNALQSFAVFSQLVLCLAVAEKRFDFEHRDLHTGNILIEPTSETTRKYYLLGEEIIIKTQGYKATIIDYTLSRIIFNGLCLFNDLSTDEELFTAEGDYQFEIYREMKRALQNQWNVHAPKTSVFWLHYLLDKLISSCAYREKTSKIHRETLKSMKELSKVLLDFNSVSEIVSRYFSPNLNESSKEN